MKNLTKIYIAFIFGVFLMLSACSGDLNSTNEGEGLSADNLLAGAEELVAAPTYKNCESLCAKNKRDTTSYVITKACVDCLVENFKSNGSLFPKVLDSETGTKVNMRGFEIKEEEINQLNAAVQAIKKAGQTPKVHGMFGVKYDGKDAKPELYFEIQGLDKSSNAVSTTYYDFTQPCPDFCP